MAEWVAAAAMVIGAGGSVYYGRKQAKQAKKLKDLQIKALALKTADLAAQTKRLKDVDVAVKTAELERKRKLLAKGEHVPSTILTSPAGVQKQPTIHHRTLLG